jgi:phosphoribosylformimino-5-aminoimidazole carboxamide ribotide isomerase
MPTIPPPRLIAVMDVQRGVVVRAVGGDRATYRPVVSRLTTSTRPDAVAAAFREHYGLTELYLADLGALAGAPPEVETIRRLSENGFRPWVDAGVRDMERAAAIASAGAHRVIVALESLRAPALLRSLVAQFGSEIIAFSLDLRGGKPVGGPAAWRGWAPDAIAAAAVNAGVRQLIVLDVASVGRGEGTQTEALCARLHTASPHVALLAGGGVRTWDDVERLGRCGAAGVLVASGLHDQTLTMPPMDGTPGPRSQ